MTIAVLTGDIIHSQKGKTEEWTKALKETLHQYGNENIDWEIYRGDSFQLKTTPRYALLAALHIKAAIKQNKQHDVRIAIGIGNETKKDEYITQSHGSAYVNSGHCFDQLKKKTLAFKSNDKTLDYNLNTSIPLAMIIANNWTTTVAKTIKHAIENPSLNQKELSVLLTKRQSNISSALKRGAFDEIMSLNSYYNTKIKAI